MTEIKFKQFIIIPKRPKMSIGKVASQTAHATFMALEKQRKTDPKLIEQWKKSGMCVIVLQCENEIKLHGIAEYFKQWNIPGWGYIDEGLTEVSPFTMTCYATGVLPSNMWWPFDKLRLFR